MTLAEAIMRAYGHQQYFNTFARRHRRLRVLEINDAGQLGQFLAAMPHRVLVHYPDVDMTKLPFEEASFDMVIHSDTLEHVPDPLAGLRETRRVLRRNGFACFTVPLVVGRLTRTTEGRPPTYHGREEAQEYLVHTEFGADAWTSPIAAGFTEVRLVSLDFPASVAMAAQK